MFIILNGPLGIGKSTLAEALTESMDHCAMLNGDLLLAVNPPPSNEIEYLHSTIALGADLGEPFDVSAPPSDLVPLMLRRLAVP